MSRHTCELRTDGAGEVYQTSRDRCPACTPPMSPELADLLPEQGPDRLETMTGSEFGDVIFDPASLGPVAELVGVGYTLTVRMTWDEDLRPNGYAVALSQVAGPRAANAPTVRREVAFFEEGGASAVNMTRATLYALRQVAGDLEAEEVGR